MAKVNGPLFSISASGKIADAMVHFPWKGLNVVRGWVKPANRMTAAQGNARLILGSLGRAMSVCDKTSLFHDDMVLTQIGQETWVSAFVRWATEHYIGSISDWETQYDAYTGHAHKAAFDAAAVTLGLNDFSLPYQGTSDNGVAGFIVYLIGLVAISIHTLDSSRFNRSPYTTALASWNTTECDALVDDLAAV